MIYCVQVKLEGTLVKSCGGEVFAGRDDFLLEPERYIILRQSS